MRAAFFEFLVKRKNKQSGFILAGHSQGSHHLIRLLKEEFDVNTKAGILLRESLIVSYLVGYECGADSFPNSNLEFSSGPTTGKIVCFSTMGISDDGNGGYMNKYKVKNHLRLTTNPTATNPYSWVSSSGMGERASKALHMGALQAVPWDSQVPDTRTLPRKILTEGLMAVNGNEHPPLTISEVSDNSEVRRAFGHLVDSEKATKLNELVSGIVDCQVRHGFLYVWDCGNKKIDKFLTPYRCNIETYGLGLKMHDYHLGEYCLFWNNIRLNVIERVEAHNIQSKTF